MAQKTIDFENDILGPIGSLKGDIADFLFKSKNLFDKSKINDNSFYAGDSGNRFDNVGYCCIMLPFTKNDVITVTGHDYQQVYFDENKQFLGNTSLNGSPLTIVGSEISVYNPSTGITADSNLIAYIGLNINKSSYNVDTYMVCNGDELPFDYEPYGEKKLVEDVSVDYSQIKNKPKEEEIYTIGSDGTFGSFTGALKYLKDNANKKTIYIKEGVYDIFQELGGSDYMRTLTNPSQRDWKEVSQIVPPNTTIIGVGNVTLRFAPTKEEIGVFDENLDNYLLASMFSPLNISYNCHIENISIEATNCRYAIHDEWNAGLTPNDTVHEYVNVRAKKTSGYYGNPQVFGSGIGANARWFFDSCEFRSDMTEMWTVHTNISASDDSASIIMNNCIIDDLNPSESTKSKTMMTFISGGNNVSHRTLHNYVKLNNTYIGGKIFFQYGGAETDTPNRFDVSCVGGYNNGYIVDETFATNPYPMRIYK